jgi:hypothetical protein
MQKFQLFQARQLKYKQPKQKETNLFSIPLKKYLNNLTQNQMDKPNNPLKNNRITFAREKSTR